MKEEGLTYYFKKAKTSGGGRDDVLKHHIHIII
jgi:hypothetical protein